MYVLYVGMYNVHYMLWVVTINSLLIYSVVPL